MEPPVHWPEWPLSPEQRDVIGLIDAISMLRPIACSLAGRAQFERASVSYSIDATLEWTADGGTIDFVDALGQVAKHMRDDRYGPILEEADFATVLSSENQWIASEVTLGEWSQKINTRTNSITHIANLRTMTLSVGDSQAAMSAEILVFRGTAFRSYAQAFPTDLEHRGGSRDGFLTTIFGRKAVVRELKERDHNGLPFVAVGIDGLSLTHSEIFALTNIMSFLAGRTGYLACRVRLDKSYAEVYRELYATSAPVAQAKPPIVFAAGNNAVASLALQFPHLLDVASELAREGINYEIALLHLLADHRHMFDVEIRDITLALDALIESAPFRPESARLLPVNEYATLLEQLKPVLANAVVSANHPQSVADGLFERLKGANDATYRYRREAFWRRVGFNLWPHEKNALRYRHPMSHAGFVTKDDHKSVVQLSRDILVARTLVNRVILTLLGYVGDICDYMSGQNRSLESFRYYNGVEGPPETS